MCQNYLSTLNKGQVYNSLKKYLLPVGNQCKGKSQLSFTLLSNNHTKNECQFTLHEMPQNMFETLHLTSLMCDFLKVNTEFP